ncbi:DNA polymerase I [Clostridium sp. 'deep sea']|uniref:DNA polymerase I n=1 Tax=Clostridium sp. 'deep sea' TaxID=2779445 RepID=UPI00189654CF|nr:DNA polymerase I [Clostridium sp. 'deep sea']QOR36446.1 DNA polymerase I [Clostridium sp. 'deep sea']
MKKLVLIDGHSLAFRAFYALPLSMQTASGIFTNASYGFTSMLKKIYKDIQPDYIIVAFDKSKTTFRNEIFADYKGTRGKMPDELHEQIEYIEQLLDAHNIKQIKLEGYEADDIIGTISKVAEQKGDIQTIIITGDRDLYQLVDKNTAVYYTKKGISDIDEMNLNAIKTKYGITPQQLIDVKALMGDKSDNIPGVPGVGEKTALKLITEYHNIEEVYNNIDKVKGKALPKKLADNKELAFMSYKLAKIDRKAPVDFEWLDIEVNEVNTNELYKLYTKLEFNKFLQDLNQNEQLNEKIEDLKELQVIIVNKENEIELLNNINCLSFFLNPDTDQLYVIDNNKLYQFNTDIWQSKQWVDVLTNVNIKKVTHGLKQAVHYFNKVNIEIKGIIFDTELAGYVLDPTSAKYSLPLLISKYLPEKNISIQALNQSLLQAVSYIPDLYMVMSKKIEELFLNELYCEVELPLATVLAQVEENGISVDSNVLKDMATELNIRINQLTTKIYDLAGEEFNINSPKQLGLILFDKLGLPVIKKTKTGYSTSQEVLETLALEHELPALIIHYRQLAKLKSTYVDGLITLITEQGKIHTTFNQTVTATGRLSSTEPNLQNIPIRLEEGRRIRRAFVPSTDYDFLLAADYSQIELRILAHMSGDPILTDSFTKNEDIHTRTASEVFNVTTDKVDREMRARAKAVNFGIVYGMSDYGLARDIKVSRKEAAVYINNYFERYKAVRAYLDQTVVDAKSNGYVETILNRRRYLPNINSRNYHQRSFAERIATNTPIQGSAADLIKLAMVRLQHALLKGKYKSRMLLQVHDELILEVTKEELPEIADLLEKTMKNAMQLSVPIKVDVKVGVNWYQMEEYKCQNYQK